MTFNSPVLAEIYDPSANIAIAIDLDSYRLLKSIFGNIPRKVSSDLFNIVKSFGVNMNNHAYWLLEKTMRKLVPAGIPQYIRKTVYDFLSKFAQSPTAKGPKVFSFKDLKFGFVIWLIAISIALAVFIIEIVLFYGKVILKSSVGIFFIIKMIRRITQTIY